MGDAHTPLVPTTTALCGLTLPPARVGQLASASGLPVWQESPGPPSCPDPGLRVVVLFGSTPPVMPPPLWFPPRSAWIDVADLGDQEALHLIHVAESCSLYCSVTSASVQRLPLARGLACAIAARWPLAETARSDIELVLHEGITNALIHGNLEIGGLRDLSVVALDRFAHEVAGRVTDPRYATRRVEIICRVADGVATVEIADQGPGFVPTDSSNSAAGGRGLALIEALSLSFRLLDGGRRICMRLALT